MHALVKRFENSQMCALAQCDGIAHDGLSAREPCWAEISMVDVKFGRVIEQCAANELCFGA